MTEITHTTSGFGAFDACTRDTHAALDRMTGQISLVQRITLRDEVGRGEAPRRRPATLGLAITDRIWAKTSFFVGNHEVDREYSVATLALNLSWYAQTQGDARQDHHLPSFPEPTPVTRD